MHPVVSTIWDIGITIGPVIGYIYQCFLIKKKRTVGTFSINICGMLLFCNILRIGFYFFQKYAKTLFVQSFLMIFTQIMLVSICVPIMEQEGKFKNQNQVYDQYGLNLVDDFWNWRNLKKYYLVIGIFTTGTLVLSAIFNALEWNIIGSFIGFLSLISQSLLFLPQVLQNYKQKRVKGLSHFLVALNNVGDIMKLAYFFVNDQPFQFKFCGFIQVFIDIFVIIQICYYRKAKQTDDTQSPAKESKVQQKQQKQQKQTASQKQAGQYEVMIQNQT